MSDAVRHIVEFVLYVGLLSAIVFFATGCRTQYVTVPEVHTVVQHTTDTVVRVDSVLDRETLVVREVDSATLAQYGIVMEDMQRAWLVESKRLQRELTALREARTDTLVVRDSIPYPVEVTREVTVRSSYDRFCSWFMWVTAVLCLLAVAWWCFKKFYLRR